MRRKGTSRLLPVMLCMALLLSVTGIAVPEKASAANTTYYVDSAGGNDSNNGTGTGTAWKTLTKVNSVTFQPGDIISFKAGGIWTGKLAPQGSGSSASPIKIDQYGTGAKPVIDGGGAVDAAVFLNNQQYWEINNLEITNNSTTEGTRRGVYVRGENVGTLNHIYLKNLYIHDIKGDNTFTGNGKGTGGIYFYIYRDTSKTLAQVTQTKFNDIQVQNVTIERAGRTGISLLTDWQKNEFKYWATNVAIRNNTLNYIDGDGMIVIGADQPVMEYNRISEANYVCGPNQTRPGYNGGWAVGMFPFFSEGAKIQFNEVYNTRSVQDGQAFDIDGNNNNAVVQYNYSHDNEGGFLLNMVDNYAGGSRTQNSTIRYNVSQNDKNRVFTIQFVSNVQVYNNTIYLGAGQSTTIFWHKTPGTNEVAVDNIAYTNNLIYNLGSGIYDIAAGTNVSYTNNWYYGNHPASEPTETNKASRTADPRLVNPGAGTSGIDLVNRANNLPGYKLQSTSPLINAGVAITGLSYSGLVDFWGGNALYGANPDIGAFEYQIAASSTPTPTPTPTPSGNLALNKTATADSSCNTTSELPASAVDGLTTTKWCSPGTGGQYWMKVDLGASFNVNQFKVTHAGSENASWITKNYTIQTSTDNVNWTTAVTVTNNTTNVTTHNITASAARYVKLNITTPTNDTNTSARIYEFEVYGAGGATPTPTPTPTPNGNLALNKTATADSSCSSTTETPAKAVDGISTTKWCSQGTGGVYWWQVDLGASYSISQFLITHAGNENGAFITKNYTIQTSPDNVTWTTRVTVTNNTTNIITHSITAASARYVKLNITTPTQDGSTAARIYEFEVR